MENETTKRTPILEIAWTRYATVDDAARRRIRGFYQIRRVSIWISVLAIFFVFLNTLFFEGRGDFFGLVFKMFFVAIPIVASISVAFAGRYYSDGSWLLMRAGAEKIRRDIYLYRTIWNKTQRGARLQYSLETIQRQLFQNLGGDSSFKPYNGTIPPFYNPKGRWGDPGFHDLNGEEYFRYRVEDQLNWHNKRVNTYQTERSRIFIYLVGMGGAGSILAAIGAELSIFVALTSAITLALLAWQELTTIDIRAYGRVITGLTAIYDHWQNLEPEQVNCEKILWSYYDKIIPAEEQVTEESDLQEEAALVEGLIAKAVETAGYAERN
jgi:hypothetical protein